ncbi:ATP-binding protein [uncultured Parolsenella sp.]|uniref:ATP-binding protein n=1 Tax=uncultured Parolsenella sp. TaxID=2083008 RepID=UPI0025D339EA|nr:ATP-binding protein [uncultured Parolsenella sp.]
MADAFYPFVGEGPTEIGAGADKVENSTSPELGEVVTNPTRIAIFDDPTAAPRVVVIQPSDVRSYLEEITATVTRLAKEQGGKISFTVIREVVENLVHAYFKEPTVSILDGGNTIRFSDQGPGIREKDRALEYGTSSATEEMKKYIRGVGSGLPYAQQYMEDHGGTLTIEDNINCGTIVTISMPNEDTNGSVPAMQPTNEAWQQPQGAAVAPGQNPYQQGWQPGSQQYPPHMGTQYPHQMLGYPQQGMGQLQPQAQQGMGQLQPQAQQGMPRYQQGYPQQTPQPWAAGAWPAAQGAPQGYYPYAQGMPQAPYQQQMPWQQQMHPAPLSERAQQVIAYLAQHESVGVVDLVAAYGGSNATWSRQLQEMENQGIVAKRGQKRFLTDMGMTLIQQQ